MAEPGESSPPWLRRAGLVAGPALFGLLLAIPLEGVGPVARRVLAVTAWVGMWWLTEPVPLPITSLLPFVLLPMLGVMSSQKAAQGYQGDSIFLFLGGFMLALALEQYGVHRRLANALIRLFGTRARRLVFGYYVTVTFTSCWLSNTATTLLFLPAALALSDEARRTWPDAEGARRFTTTIVLGTALCASIGGMGTPIGTVPNMVFAEKARAIGHSISFFQWSMVGIPVVVVLALALWVTVTFVTCRYPAGLTLPGFEKAVAERTPWTREQRLVGGIFALAVLLWFTRNDIRLSETLVVPGWSTLLANHAILPAGAPRLVSDATVAILLAMLLFLLPARGGRPLLDWSVAEKIPWGVLLLLGGSFALADAFDLPDEHTSLTAWFAGRLAGLSGIPELPRFMLMALAITALGEFASNVAVAALLIPVGFALARATGDDPMVYGYLVCFTASCSFMLPVATPPNAIVYGTGRLRLSDMLLTGCILDILGALLVPVVVRLVLRS